MTGATGESVRRRRGDRGAVAVEAALVTPLLLLLVFGIIEFSLLLRDHVAVSSAVRTGGRIASTGAGAGPGVCDTGPTAPPCTPDSSPALAQAAADAIQRAGSAMPKDSIDYIYVYRSNPEGYPGPSGNTTIPDGSCGYADCVKFTWVASQNRFRYTSGSWNSSTINACLNDPNAMTVGVYLKATHNFVTGIFADDMVVADRAVMKFEPLATELCASGMHP
jgi:hypothetical protein